MVKKHKRKHRKITKTFIGPDPNEFNKLLTKSGYKSSPEVVSGINNLIISGKYDEADECLKRMISIYPEIPKFYNLYIKLYSKKGDLKGAEAIFERAKKLGAIDEYTYPSIISSYYSFGKYSKVIELFDEAYSTIKLFEKTFSIAIISAYELGDLDKSVSIFEYATKEMNYHTPGIYNSMLTVYKREFMKKNIDEKKRQEIYEKAINIFESASINNTIDHPTIDPITYVLIVNIYIKNNELIKAMNMCNKGINMLGIDNAHALFGLRADIRDLLNENN